MPEPSIRLPHQGQPVYTAGLPLAGARAAMILVHGRGGSAAGILGLAQSLAHPGLAYLAPQAAGSSWWPQRFLAPVEQNQPWLTSALQVMADLVAQIRQAGIPDDQIIIGGFSQGAVLAAEFVARQARRYGGLFVFSGALFGPPGTTWNYPGSLDGMPVFIGCSDDDPHIPLERVEETAQVLTRLGGAVTKKIYPGAGHTILEDEIQEAQKIIAAAIK